MIMLHSNFDVYYNVSVSEYSLRKNANENNITYESAIKMKLRFLLDAITYWELVEFKEMVERTFDSIVKVKNMMHKSEIKHKQDISDDDIAYARSVPIENVIEFVKGKALAFCHPDKNPSLSWDRKNNRARCFVCDKSFDTIGVLMERDGMTFVNAVKALR